MNTLYNLHFYNEKNEVLQIVTYKRTYIDLVHSSSFFAGTWRDGKLHISGRNRKRWGEIVVVLASSVCPAACRTWVHQEKLQNTVCDESLQSLSIAHPA